jgi:hypothetical protein
LGIVGRKAQDQPLVPATYIRECFDIRDKTLIWRERPASHFARRPEDHARFNRQRAGQPAGFKINGQHVVRLQFDGRTRRIAASRVAWCLSAGEWPVGLLAKRSHQPNGKASSLARRAEADMTLIKAMSEAPDASIAKLSALTGSPESCVSARLGRFAAAGFAASPMCVPGRSWCLTGAGKALAMNGQPLIDELDRDILTIIARAPVRQLALARRLGVCSLTAKRRLGLLIAQGLADAQDGRFRISDVGVKALGSDAPQRWIDSERIRAANARDVLARGGSDLLTTAERGRMGGLAMARGSRAMPSVELDRIAS